MPEERARIWLNVLSSFTKIKEDTESFNSEKVSGLESCGPETATPFAVAWLPSHRHGATPRSPHAGAMALPVGTVVSHTRQLCFFSTCSAVPRERGKCIKRQRLSDVTGMAATKDAPNRIRGRQWRDSLESLI